MHASLLVLSDLSIATTATVDTATATVRSLYRCRSVVDLFEGTRNNKKERDRHRTSQYVLSMIADDTDGTDGIDAIYCIMMLLLLMMNTIVTTLKKKQAGSHQYSSPIMHPEEKEFSP